MVREFLVRQAGQPLAIVEATDANAALKRAKGLGSVINLASSLPLTVEDNLDGSADVPIFRDDYFKLLGFID